MMVWADQYELSGLEMGSPALAGSYVSCYCQGISCHLDHRPIIYMWKSVYRKLPTKCENLYTEFIVTIYFH